MKNRYLLSIIIPSFNSGQTLPNLLSSINRSVSVDFSAFEALIVDDASTDDTLKTIDHLKPKLKFPLALIRQSVNSGPARCRNLGANQAKGRFLLFLDSDVVLKPRTLTNIFQLIASGKVRAFTGIWHWRQKTQRFFPQYKALRDWAYWFIERKKFARYYLFSTRIAGIEKKLFQKIGGFNESFPEPTVEDIELTYRIEKITPIKFSTDIVVSHEFEDFWPIAVKYFKRSRDWVGLYLKRLRFDPVATSQREAVKSIVATLIPMFTIFSFFHVLFSYPLVSLLTIFVMLELDFWRFLVKKKGLGFLLKGIFVSLILYFIINLGAFWGLILYYINLLYKLLYELYKKYKNMNYIKTRKNTPL